VRLTGQPLAASYARRDAAADTHRYIPIALTPSDRPCSTPASPGASTPCCWPALWTR
jgi:hypothetical protein